MSDYIYKGGNIIMNYCSTITYYIDIQDACTASTNTVIYIIILIALRPFSNSTKRGRNYFNKSTLNNTIFIEQKLCISSVIDKENHVRKFIYIFVQTINKAVYCWAIYR